MLVNLTRLLNCHLFYFAGGWACGIFFSLIIDMVVRKLISAIRHNGQGSPTPI